MEPSGSRLRVEMLKASGAAWPYCSGCGLVALMGAGGGLLALFLALLLRAFSGVVGPPKASPQPVPPDGGSIGSGCTAAGGLTQTPTGDGDTEDAKARPVGSGTEVAPSSSAHVARLSRRGPGHGPRGTSTGSQVARDGSNAWYSSRYGYMSELENRASAEGRSADRRAASPPGPLGPPRMHAFKRTGMPLRIRCGSRHCGPMAGTIRLGPLADATPVSGRGEPRGASHPCVGV